MCFEDESEGGNKLSFIGGKGKGGNKLFFIFRKGGNKPFSIFHKKGGNKLFIRTDSDMVT